MLGFLGASFIMARFNFKRCGRTWAGVIFILVNSVQAFPPFAGYFSADHFSTGYFFAGLMQTFES